MNSANIAVIGLGSVGAFAFAALAGSDRSVIGFEAGGVANDRSAVGGDTRLFRRLYREGPAYRRLLERSFELWQEIGTRVTGAFIPTGAINVVPPDSEAAKALAEYGATFDVPHQFFDSAELSRRFPQFHHHDDVIAFHDPGGGIVRTDLVVRDAVDRGRQAGGRIVDAQVTSIETSERSVTIRDEHGETWSVDRVIVATGARSLALLPELSEVAVPRRLLMTWFQAVQPEDFAPDRLPVFTYDRDGMHAYGAPAIDGRHVKVSGIIPHRDLRLSGYDYDSSVSRDELRHCAETLPRIINGLYPAPVRTAVYPDLYTDDLDFILDFTGPDRRVFAATGFSGKGFKMCSALGEHAALAITDEVATIPEFSLTRFPR